MKQNSIEALREEYMVTESQRDPDFILNLVELNDYIKPTHKQLEGKKYGKK